MRQDPFADERTDMFPSARLTFRTLGLLGLVALAGCTVAAVEGLNIARDQAAYSAHIDAARAGHPAAQYQVGNALCCSLTEGSGPFYNTPQAVSWLCRSAAQDYGPAAFRLGEIYSGTTVKGVRLSREATGLVTGHMTSRPVAYGWMSRAAALNQPHAAQKRDEIWQNMSPAERERAQQMANGQAPLLCEWREVTR